MANKKHTLPRGQRLMNAIFIRFVRWGMIPGAHLISVPGRKSGILHTTPVFVLPYESHRWLVAGFEHSDWVKNLRTSGWCLLIHDGHEERVNAIEVSDAETRAPLLQAFVRRAPGGMRGFAIKPDAPQAAFVAIAPHHPVFRLEELAQAS